MKKKKITQVFERAQWIKKWLNIILYINIIAVSFFND